MSGDITTCLGFDNQAGEAAQFYVGLFDDSAVNAISHYGDNIPMPAGTVLLVDFTLRRRAFQALNGGAFFKPSESISLSVDCGDQAELDRIWDGLLAGGGTPVQCGWLKDRFGVSWQVVPRMMGEMQRTGSPEQVGRMMAAMMGMVKLDIAALKAAFAGE